MKSLPAAFLGFLLLGALQTSSWPNRRAVEGTLPQVDDFAAIELDTILYKEAQPDLRDLRLVDGASQEVPYQIITLSPRKILQMVKAKVIKQTPATQGYEHLPLNGLELKIKKEKFSRYARVESSHDTQEWRFVNAATLTAPSKENPFPYQRLPFSTSRDMPRYLRLNIEHGDDVPLPITQIKGYKWRQWLVFKHQGSGPYFVYFGKAGASSPQYDWKPFSEIEKQLPTLTKMSLDPTQPNTDYKKPLVTPRLFLILALIFVTVVLGILILSLLRRAPKG